MGDAYGSPASDDSSDIYASPSRNDFTHSLPLERRAMDLGPKRKLSMQSSQSPDKRRKTEARHGDLFPELPAVAGLPAEIWQCIFRQVHPLMLYRLRRVSHAFRRYLSDSEAHRWLNPRKSRLQVLDAETVWSDSRKLYYPNMPRPLVDCSETDMWKLILGQNCMFCGRLPKVQSHPEKPSENGPGSEGEATLLFSSSTSLLPALPFAIITKDLHVISSIAAQDFGGLPPASQWAKIYYKPHIEEIERQLRETQTLGSAAVEEWGKGLAATGKEKLMGAARWERFEAKGGLESIRHDILTTRSVREMSTFSFGQSSPRSTMTPSSASGILPASRYARDSSIPHSITHFGRGGRDIRDVNHEKALKRAEIERRCELLQPPITRNVLQYMESFRAAVQIPMALTENAWAVLLPRLLAQRSDAEKQALEAATKGRASVAKSEKRGNQNLDPKGAQDQGWDECQAPLRNRLGCCADRIIRDRWAGGDAVHHGNCPVFAASVLLESRHVYYAESDYGETGATSRRPLILDDMKWLYDSKIRPITEKFRRDLFLCNDCPASKKPFGFEAVIQHYGAKHTTSFNKGNNGVAWREAKWPDHPPFQPNPGKLTNGAWSSHHQNRNTWNTSRLAAFQQRMDYSSAAPPDISSSPQTFAASQVSPRQTHGAPLPSASQWMPPESGPPNGIYPAQIRPETNQIHYSSFTNAAAPPPSGPPRTLHNAPMPQVSGQNFDPRIGPHTEIWPADTRDVWHQTRYDSRVASAHRPDDPGNHVNYHGYIRHPASSSMGASSQSTVGLTRSEVDTLSEVASHVWSSLADVPELLPSLRVYIVIFYMGQASRSQFNQNLDIGLFKHVLNHNATTPSIKNAAGLACRMCTLHRDDQHAAYRSYYSKIDKSQKYNLGSLVDHFLQNHASELVANTDRSHSPPDWKELMIELPEAELIDDLEHAPGMDAEKKQLFTRVFPIDRRSSSARRVIRKPYNDPNQGHDYPPKYNDTELISRDAMGNSQIDPRVPASSSYFAPLTELPRDEPSLHSTRGHSQAELSFAQHPLPEARRLAGSEFQNQDEAQQVPTQAVPIPPARIGRVQSSFHISEEPLSTAYRRRPNESYVYVPELGSPSRPIPAHEDINVYHETNGDRLLVSSTGLIEDVPRVQYISRSKDYSPAEEETDNAHQVPDKAPGAHSTENVAFSLRNLDHASDQALLGERLPEIALERASNEIQRPPQVSGVSESFRRVRFSPPTEISGWHRSPATSHTRDTNLLMDPRTMVHSDPSSGQPSAIATPIRVHEQPPQAMVRSSSRRFERYEAARRHLERTVSQSPAQRLSIAAQETEREHLPPAQSDRQPQLMREDRPDLSGNQVGFAHPPSIGERREYLVRLPAESNNAHAGSTLAHGNFDTVYEMPEGVFYYEDRNAQGTDYVRYRLETAQDREQEQRRVRYVPEHEVPPMEMVDRRQEDLGTSVPPNAGI
ncbi:MAG: hypothetical protein M1821_002784 [Bathelium mastoideum]|nr:MAG: hypothetical protein M1821_002784 [Bathelium mastoideum]